MQPVAILSWHTWRLSKALGMGASQLAAPEHAKSCSSGLVTGRPCLHTPLGPRPLVDRLFSGPHDHGGHLCGRC